MVHVSPKTGEMTLLLYPDLEDSGVASQPTNRDGTIDKMKAAQQMGSALRLVYAGKKQPGLQYVVASDVYVDAKIGKLIGQERAEKKSVAVSGQGKTLVLKTSDEVADLLERKLSIKVEQKAFIGVNPYGISYSWNDGQGNGVSVETTDDGAFLRFSQMAADGRKNERETTYEQAKALGIAHLEKFLSTVFVNCHWKRRKNHLAPFSLPSHRRSTGFPSWIILIKCRSNWQAGLLPSLRVTFRIYLGYRRIRQQKRCPRKRRLIYLYSMLHWNSCTCHLLTKSAGIQNSHGQ
ncbi:hypothetical protein [Brevibacillus porteri]|uniref:hypothetical protein n=1 Tax=Brevibacillus porteri TaxID=2126350 RepID=UPI003D1EA8D0